MNEHEAIDLVKNKNLKGLAFLVQTYQIQAMRTAALITGDAVQAQDLVQNAFLRFYEKAAGFDARRPFKPYFLRMIINDALKSASREKQNLSLDTLTENEAFDLMDLNPLPEEVFERKETELAVRDALLRLPPDQRAVIVMRYYLEMNEKELKEVLGGPIGTLKWRLYSARCYLAEMLKTDSDLAPARSKTVGMENKDE